MASIGRLSTLGDQLSKTGCGGKLRGGGIGTGRGFCALDVAFVGCLASECLCAFGGGGEIAFGASCVASGIGSLDPLAVDIGGGGAGYRVCVNNAVGGGGTARFGSQSLGVNVSICTHRFHCSWDASSSMVPSWYALLTQVLQYVCEYLLSTSLCDK